MSLARVVHSWLFSVFVRRPGDYGEIWGRGDERDVMGGLLGTTQGFLRMRQLLASGLTWVSHCNFRFGQQNHLNAKEVDVKEKMEPNYDREQFTAGWANCTLRSKTNSPYILLIGSILSLCTCRLESGWLVSHLVRMNTGVKYILAYSKSVSSLAHIWLFVDWER